MDVRGRWRKKTKDIVPIKRRTVDLSVWLSEVGLCSLASTFSFFGHAF